VLAPGRHLTRPSLARGWHTWPRGRFGRAGRRRRGRRTCWHAAPRLQRPKRRIRHQVGPARPGAGAGAHARAAAACAHQRRQHGILGRFKRLQPARVRARPAHGLRAARARGDGPGRRRRCGRRGPRRRERQRRGGCGHGGRGGARRPPLAADVHVPHARGRARRGRRGPWRRRHAGRGSAIRRRRGRRRAGRRRAPCRRRRAGWRRAGRRRGAGRRQRRSGAWRRCRGRGERLSHARACTDSQIPVNRRVSHGSVRDRCGGRLVATYRTCM